MNIFDVSRKLGLDLAEDSTASGMAEMFIEDSKTKAAKIREQAEKHIDSDLTQRFDAIEREISSAIYKLLKGYKGYKLVKDETKTNTN